MPTLIVIGPKLAVREYELKNVLSIGRHESNAIQLTEEKASRMHCSVRMERGRAIIEDLNSANGVYVNGLRAASQTLSHNDRIVIGATTLIFSDPDSPEKMVDTRVLVASISSDVNAIVPDALLPDSVDQKNRAAVAVVERPDAAARTGRPARRMARGRESYGGIFVFCILILAALAVWYWQMQPVQPVAMATPAKQIAPPPRVETPLVVQPAFKPEPERAPVTQTETAPETPRLSLDEQLKAALMTRDRALGNGNLLGAKAALQSFLIAVPPAQSNDESVRRAQRELEGTTKVANAALEMSLEQARDALKAHHFHLVSQRSTSLISNDPHGPYGQKARAMLEQIDAQTAQAASAAKAKAFEAIGRGQLSQARSAVEAVMGELNGTRWAGDMDALQLQLIVAGGFLDKIEAERAKKAAAGEAVPLRFAAKKIDGTLLSVNGLQARMRIGSGQIEMPISLKNLETKEFVAMLDTLELSDHYAELACLWSVLGRLDAARKASEAALKKPGDIPLAATLAAGLLTNSKNVHLYDFKSWRQQMDWEAVSGSWLSQDGKYVLETADGGETALKAASIGGTFPLEAARVGFEFEIRKPSPGWLFVCELGNEKQALVLSFNATEAILQDKSGAKSPAIKWSPATTRVELSIDGDSVAFTLDGKLAATLNVAGIAKEKGTISFHARQCACAIDNVILRSRE